MKIGKLRHVIKIQKKVGSQDEKTGAMSYCWKNFAKVRASIEALSVKEYIQSSATQSQTQARITLRYIPGLRPTMRIVHGDNIYNPQGILPDMKSGKHYLTIPCSIGVNDGE